MDEDSQYWSEIRRTENACAVLRDIAEKYPKNSNERKAIRRAAYALVYLALNYSGELDKHMEWVQSPPTPEELEGLAGWERGKKVPPPTKMT